MRRKLSVGAWKKEIGIVIDSKVREFHIIGYRAATHQEVWDCLLEAVWEGEPELYIYEVVQDVLSLKGNTYMNFLTKNTYVDQDLMASIHAITENISDKK